jgi:hypothetical protein
LGRQVGIPRRRKIDYIPSPPFTLSKIFVIIINAGWEDIPMSPKGRDALHTPAGIFYFLCYNYQSGLGRDSVYPLKRKKVLVPSPLF